MVLGGLVAAVTPAAATPALLAGFAGGVFPDLDLYTGHRRRLHYPVYYTALAGVVLAAAALVPGAFPLGVFLAAAALHSVTDVLGGGLELRPWEGTSDRAVYSHYHGRWLAPRRWIRYDGSPRDLAVSLALAVPVLFSSEGLAAAVAAGAVLVGAVYAATRRRLPALATRIVEDVFRPRLPDRLLRRVPARYRSAAGPEPTGAGSGPGSGSPGQGE
jgi:hypothetical protein